jgi:hypothetical protein
MKKVFFAIGCVLLTVASCFAQNPATTTNASTAFDAASARAFITSVIQRYQNHGKGLEDSDYKYYVHSSLNQLLDEDNRTLAAEGTDKPYAADLDLICDCQEYQGVWNLKMDAVVFKDLPVVHRTQAYVIANFLIYPPSEAGFNETRIMEYILEPEDGHWKIYDSYNLLEGNATARKWLTDEIKQYKELIAAKAHKTTAKTHK